MAAISKIEWADASWNPVTGCTKTSDGCTNCYARRLAKRLKAMGNHRYTNEFKVTLHPDLIDLPFRWKKPKRIFVNSMSDLFHEEIPENFIRQVFETMQKASWHTFQILTKRSKRLVQLAPSLPWPNNVWQGVTVENDKTVYRIQHLKTVPAKTRFLSCEPLLSLLPDLDLDGIQWLIAGGESGPGARPMEDQWVRSLRDQCVRKGVNFFFKQWGGVQKHRNGRILDGRTWDNYPYEAIDLNANRERLIDLGLSRIERGFRV